MTEAELGKLMLARAIKEGHRGKLPDMTSALKHQAHSREVFASKHVLAVDKVLEYIRSIAPREVRSDDISAALRIGREAARHSLHRLACDGLVESRVHVSKLKVRLWKATENVRSRS